MRSRWRVWKVSIGQWRAAPQTWTFWSGWNTRTFSTWREAMDYASWIAGRWQE